MAANSVISKAGTQSQKPIGSLVSMPGAGSGGLPLRPRAGKPRIIPCGYVAKVRITVHADGVTIVREGHGSGEGHGNSPGEVHDIALKAAETDATKRALATFGNPFGLELYRKDKSWTVQDLPALKPAIASPPTQPRLGSHPDDTTPIPRPSHYYGRRHRGSMTELLRQDQARTDKDNAARPPLAPVAPPVAPHKIDKSHSRSPNPSACATRRT
jgi:Rad52/22 family double-strand break repair protein